MHTHKATALAIVSQLERFAQMRASRPIISNPNNPSEFLAHLFAVRDWAQQHDQGVCQCADSGWCPRCSLECCPVCERKLTSATRVCDSCLMAADEELYEHAADAYEWQPGYDWREGGQ